MTFDATPEQFAALDLFREGNPMAIQAAAGAGKTSTLTLLAADTARRGVYVAFNRAIVNDAGEKMPNTVNCSTAHALAFRAVGRRYAHRLKGGRMKSTEIARHLAIDPFIARTPFGVKRLAPAFLAGIAMRSAQRFCQSADPVPTWQHVPYQEGIDLPTDTGRRTYDNNRELARTLAPIVAKVWADWQNPDGRLPFNHDAYLKAWAVDQPTISCDFLLLDEAQDTNPVLADVIWKQMDHAQVVVVGDSAQAIYEWRGAVDSMAVFAEQGYAEAFLSQSFRFGPAIADVANVLLDRLGAVLRVRGTDTIPSVVGPVAQPDCILSRTNAAAMRTLLEQVAEGQRVALVGGGSDLRTFAQAVIDLKAGKPTFHPELACFDSWGEVQDYVENDSLGDELRLLVGLMEDYGPERILAALVDMPSEADADLIVSTSHKAKGREWDRVQLAGDFPDPAKREVGAEELRLLYVAVTRARRELDVDAVALLNEQPEVAAVTGGEAPAVAASVAHARGPSPSACPGCGRTDVIRSSGIVGAHACAAVKAGA